MHYFLGVLGIVGSFFLVKYRERVGDMLGEPEWAIHVGGIYNVLVILAVFIFFFSLATLTGTTSILLKPLLWFIPGVGQQVAPPSL